MSLFIFMLVRSRLSALLIYYDQLWLQSWAWISFCIYFSGVGEGEVFLERGIMHAHSEIRGNRIIDKQNLFLPLMMDR